MEEELSEIVQDMIRLGEAERGREPLFRPHRNNAGIISVLIINLRAESVENSIASQKKDRLEGIFNKAISSQNVIRRENVSSWLEPR